MLLAALIITFAVTAVCSVSAGALRGGDLIFNDNNGIAYTLTPNGENTYKMTVSGSGGMEDFESQFNFSDYTTTVTSPYDSDRQNITEVVIDSGITHIGEYAFYDFKSLTSVSIPTTVKTIGGSAFAGCGLASVTIPEGVETINDNAFEGCRALTSVNFPSTLKSIGKNAFYQCISLASIEIPEGVLTIDVWAFCQCTSLASVTLPSTLTSIGSAAFNYCEALTDITLPDSISSIENYTFAHCFALDRIIYKDGVTLGEDAVTDTATQVKYTTDGSAVTITEIILGTGKTAVTIPSTVNGTTVAAITDQELMKKVAHTHTGGAATCTQKAACTLCGLEYGELLPHTGGTASCTAKAVCNVCGQEYGELAAHTLVKTGAVSPTCTAAGNKEYWTCSVCQKMFADGSGTAEITAIPTIAALPHNFVNGVCADCGAADPDYSQPTETEPPVTEPPVTDSSSTEPTGTQPPVTNPSDTEPTVTEPPVTDPSDTEPPVTVPPVTAPTETYPAATSPSSGYPLVIPYGYTTSSNEKMFEALAGASDGDTVVIDLNGNTDIDRSVFDEIRGRDVTVRFRLKGGAYWTVNGKDIEQSRKVDLGVRMNRMSASRDEIKELAGNKKTVKFTLRHNGKLGFSGILNVPINEKYNGKYANLYYYSKGFEFVGSSLISDGYAQFRFDHASEYIIVIDDYPHGEDVSAAAGAHSESAPIDMSNSAGRGITVRDLAFEEKFRLSNKKRRCLFNPNNQ